MSKSAFLTSTLRVSDRGHGQRGAPCTWSYLSYDSLAQIRGQIQKTAPHFAFKPEMQMTKLARSFYVRGWLLGTSGNFSSVVSRHPFYLAITSTGLDKGALTADQFVRVDASGSVVHGTGKPSAETALHLVVARVRHIGTVLHTHSVWSTLVSERHATERGLWIEGYEMLKGLRGVTSHQHREWLPILENDQDIAKHSAQEDVFEFANLL